ncbi:MAG: ATP-binding protein [Patescibacteria group bacterium]|nr:ATP-binding protein [Patescibacteria group bacterium]
MQNLLNSIISEKALHPLRVVVYGVEGVGKTAFRAAAPKPVFITTEDGAAHLGVSRFPMADSWNAVLQAVEALLSSEHDYQTLVIDSADWAERLAQAAVCQENHHSSIEGMGYGRGYTFVAEKFSQLLQGLSRLGSQKKMHCIFTAHTQIRTFNDPLSESYDMYQLKLQKQVAGLLKEWCDCLLFANFKTLVRDSDGRKQCVSYGERLLHTEHRSGFDAKNRFDLPETLPLDFKALYQPYQTYFS